MPAQLVSDMLGQGRVDCVRAGENNRGFGLSVSRGAGHERIRWARAARRAGVDSQPLIRSRLRQVRTKVLEYEIARMLAVRRT